MTAMVKLRCVRAASATSASTRSANARRCATSIVPTSWARPVSGFASETSLRCRSRWRVTSRAPARYRPTAVRSARSASRSIFGRGRPTHSTPIWPPADLERHVHGAADAGAAGPGVNFSTGDEDGPARPEDRLPGTAVRRDRSAVGVGEQPRRGPHDEDLVRVVVQHGGGARVVAEFAPKRPQHGVQEVGEAERGRGLRGQALKKRRDLVESGLWRHGLRLLCERRRTASDPPTVAYAHAGGPADRAPAPVTPPTGSRRGGSHRRAAVYAPRVPGVDAAVAQRAAPARRSSTPRCSRS